MDEAKEESYYNFGNFLSHIEENDKLILLGIFRARFGNKWNSFGKNIIGREDAKKANSTGVILMTKCLDHGLDIANALF